MSCPCAFWHNLQARCLGLGVLIHTWHASCHHGCRAAKFLIIESLLIHSIDLLIYIYAYIYIHIIYEIPSKFALVKYVLECTSDVGCCMKPAKTIGDLQKNDTFFDCACLRVLWCGHSVCSGRIVFSRLDPLHHEWVCPCGGLTLHDFTLL